MKLTSNSRSSTLPSIGYLDMEKIKREASGYNNNTAVTSVLNMPAPPLVSPSMYSGPPPPYSYPSSTASSTVGVERNGSGAGAGSYVSPPETRRTSGDEKGPLIPQRQSLPSITEALGGDQQPISISSLLSTPAPQQKISHISQSPTSPVARSNLDVLPKGPIDPFPGRTPTVYRPTDTADRTTGSAYPPSVATTAGEIRFSSSNPLPLINSYESHGPLQTPRTITSPSAYTRPGASPIQQSRNRSPIRDKAQTIAPSTNVPFGYGVNAYQPKASYPPSTPGIPSYRPTSAQQPPPWRNLSSDHERIEEIRKAMSKEDSPPKQAYGESVKRHLDIYDLETSLNEVSSIFPTSFWVNLSI